MLGVLGENKNRTGSEETSHGRLYLDADFIVFLFLLFFGLDF